MMSEYAEAGFLPPVTFTDASDAQDCYFAVAASVRGAADDLARAARDESVTVAQMNAVADKYQRLNRLANTLYSEWVRLSPGLATESAKR